MGDPRYPFGAASTPRPPRRPTEPTALFVLGVYPSALHVHWTPPRWASPIEGVGTIGALAIADEPAVFWDGTTPDPDDLVDSWKREVGFHEGDEQGQWGHVRQAGNGTSGRPVVNRVLTPLRISEASTWFSDCVNTYFVKAGAGSQGAAWDERYLPFAHELGMDAPTIPPRPSIETLIALATEHHRDRLRHELLASEAPFVVTLGEEARRVLFEVSDRAAGVPTKELTQRADRQIAEDYGQPGTVRVDGRTLDWVALVHPGQRSKGWAGLHDEWIHRQGSGQG